MKRHHFPILEQLETRTLMSLTLETALVPLVMPSKVPAIVSSTPPGTIASAGTGVTLHLVAGVPFAGEVAFYPSPVLDPPLAYSASIDWGDGTTTIATFHYGQQGTSFGLVISGAHTYVGAGTFKIVTTVMTGPLVIPGQPPAAFPTQIVARINSQAIVVARPPNTSGGVTIRETAGQAFTANVGTFTTLAPGTGLTAAISWGDGSSSTGQLQPAGVVGLDQIRFNIIGTHTYTQDGTYPIHIVVTKPTPSATAVAPQPIATIESTAVVSSSTVLSLAGTVTGTYTVPLAVPLAVVVPITNPDVGKTYHFVGVGAAGDLGTVAATGQVSLPGFIATGAATGMLTLTNALGSVTLKLTGPMEPGFGAFPATLNYVMTQGTRAYLGDTASGTIAVTLAPASSATAANRFTFVFS